MLADYGVSYAIIGHSERRRLFRETDAEVAARFRSAQDNGLTPILCVGESLEQREQGVTGQLVPLLWARTCFSRVRPAWLAMRGF